jgi:1-carboxybiuret hydrolase
MTTSTVPNLAHDDSQPGDCIDIASAIRTGQRSASEVMRSTLDSIQTLDGDLNCFTTVLAERAMADAVAVDQQRRTTSDAGPLAGVPFAVKNLFDIAGVTTIAGSKIHAERPPAVEDSTVVQRLKSAGAILVGALNMDEYAYGFTTENTNYGPTRNPHDLERVAGGSSGGSAAAVAAGMVPLTLGSDTNGSIRVPAAFCGVYGLKPTYGRISRAGAMLFAESFDHVGPFARSVRDIALLFDILHGPDPRDPIASTRPAEPVSARMALGTKGLRIAVADGYFSSGAMAESFAVVRKVAAALGVDQTVSIPNVSEARAAAYIITACEGSQLHLDDLRTRPQDFDPVVVERFLAGALLPAAWYGHAQRFRRVFRDLMREIFRDIDIILAPATPCPAIRIGQPTIMINGKEVASRPNIGIFTQPISFIGLPVLSVPVFDPGMLPMGVQLIAAPYNEGLILRAAWQLEQMGVTSAPITVPVTGGR